jgi:hypothetical protein
MAKGYVSEEYETKNIDLVTLLRRWALRASQISNLGTLHDFPVETDWNLDSITTDDLLNSWTNRRKNS